MNKIKISIYFGLILSLILSQIIPVSGVSFILYDKTNDVIHFSEGITIITYGIDEYDELDIQEFVIDGLVINITFIGIPVWDFGYNYSCYVRWNGDDDGNYTTALWSNGNDEVRTRLHDNTGTLIVDNYQEGIIDPASKSLIIPILNASLIANVFNPEYIYVIATTYSI